MKRISKQWFLWFLKCVSHTVQILYVCCTIYGSYKSLKKTHEICYTNPVIVFEKQTLIWYKTYWSHIKWAIHAINTGATSIQRATTTSIPDSKVHGANMGPTWVLSAPDGPHFGSVDLAIGDILTYWCLAMPPMHANNDAWRLEHDDRRG